MSYFNATDVIKATVFRARLRSGQPDLRRPARRARLEIEPMEGRTLLSTFTVTSPLDSGPGSLRQAITDAGDGDTVNFDESLLGSSIMLTGGELVIDDDITIVGLGFDRLAVDGAGSGRVFHVTAGAEVTIEDLAIVNGRAETGGGLLNEGGRVTLSDVGMANNRAIAEEPGASAFGGAIAVLGDGASLVVDTCTIVYNEAVGARGKDGGSGLANGTGGVDEAAASTPARARPSGSIPPSSGATRPSAAWVETTGPAESTARGAGAGEGPLRPTVRASRLRSRGVSSSTPSPRAGRADMVPAWRTASAVRDRGAPSAPTGLATT